MLNIKNLLQMTQNVFCWVYFFHSTKAVMKKMRTCLRFKGSKWSIYMVICYAVMWFLCTIGAHLSPQRQRKQLQLKRNLFKTETTFCLLSIYKPPEETEQWCICEQCRMIHAKGFPQTVTNSSESFLGADICNCHSTNGYLINHTGLNQSPALQYYENTATKS